MSTKIKVSPQTAGEKETTDRGNQDVYDYSEGVSAAEVKDILYTTATRVSLFQSKIYAIVTKKKRFLEQTCVRLQDPVTESYWVQDKNQGVGCSQMCIY